MYMNMKAENFLKNFKIKIKISNPCFDIGAQSDLHKTNALFFGAVVKRRLVLELVTPIEENTVRTHSDIF